MLWTAPVAAQTFGRDGRLVMAPEISNVAASQVAIAQTRLFGSMLVSYKADASGIARITIATRKERQVIDIDAQTYQPKLVRREMTTLALPPGALVCRSYAPIDAIVAAARVRFPKSAVEILPPHRIGMSWRARIGGTVHRVAFDSKGYAKFKAQVARG
ncbi:MAG: hypothetical protein CFE36_10595 [Sphingomonadaceae bacterium PASS1]|nr:MAG: hypothetical protein CFE36_10595 [Sphingomonadaceae bacterium PASS1]